MTAPMANPDPTLLLIRRAVKASAESRALLDESDFLLGRCVDLLDHRIHLLREIVSVGRDMSDGFSEAAGA